MTHKRRAPGKIFLFFLQDILKAAFQMRILPIDAHKQGNFFPKLGYFLPIFKKEEQGKPPTLPLSSCAPKLNYFLRG